MIGHRSLDRSGLDGDDTHPRRMQAAAKSLKEEGKSAFGGPIDVVGAASTISGDGGDGSQASGATAFQLRCEQSEDRGGADEVDLQFLQENVDRRFRIPLVVHGAVSEKDGVKVRER